MDLVTVGAAFLAGLLTFLNPCVLPVLPLVFGASAAEHRLGPVALAAGLALSFTAIGLFVAVIGFSIGLDTDVFRTASAIMLVAMGGVLVFPAAQYRMQAVLAPVGQWAAQRTHSARSPGLGSQLALGALLGAVWSPCTGPTLGAAALLASQGQQLPIVALAMLAFGIGAAVPLLLLGVLLRRKLMGLRQQLAVAGQAGRWFLGGAMALVGLAVLTGTDKQLEALFLDHAPAWAIALGTSI
ncbi:MAG: cytochrome c biogenesis CcdA family protein [Erythrobacter sp.]